MVRVFELVDLIFADEIADGTIGHNQFKSEHTTCAVGGWQQILGNDALKNIPALASLETPNPGTADKTGVSLEEVLQ